MAKDYDIAKTGGACCVCGMDLAPGQKFVATVCESEDQFHRADYCMECWNNRKDQGEQQVFGIWRTRVPAPTEKRKLFVDDELLISFFERLADADSDAKTAFRYVLALVLMRKKLLVYDRSDRMDDGTEIWHMHFKGSDQDHAVTDPKMDEQKVSEVSSQLGQILEAEL